MPRHGRAHYYSVPRLAEASAHAVRATLFALRGGTIIPPVRYPSRAARSLSGRRC